MSLRSYLLLTVLGLAVPFAISRFQSLPGYMDADYYFAGGVQLVQGRGFNEPYLWNYLDDPAGLPHPSHAYWMPLASIVAALGMWLAGEATYAAGRLPFIVFSGLVPPLTAALAFRVSARPGLAMVAGLLAIFSLYYAPFMPVPDNYALFMLSGSVFLLLAPRREPWIPAAQGALAGLMTLARSDGLLWLGLAGLSVFWNTARATDGRQHLAAQRLRLAVPAALLVLVGYLVTAGWWHARSLDLFGSPLAPGGGRVLWLQNYNQTFAYPPGSVTREAFLQAGWGPALLARRQAFASNLSNAFGAQGGIFLLPFILIGLWQLRRDLRTRIAVSGWLILFVVMTVLFPFAGSRGSFFHAGAAFQPYWWAAAPLGLDAAIQWAQRRGRFTDAHAHIFLQGILVLLAVFMTAYLVHFRVLANGWARDDLIYEDVHRRLQEQGLGSQDVVIVRNPPGYHLASGQRAVALPFGDVSTILAVAETFDATFLVLEKGGTFESIQDLYDEPRGHPALTYLGEVHEARLYRIAPSH